MVIIYEKIEPKVKNSLLFNYNYREKEIKQYYPELKLIRSESKIRRGYCFNYALRNYKDIHSCETTYSYLKSHYKNINLENIKTGDIISFHDTINNEWAGEIPSENNAEHFAKIIKTDNTLQGTIIRSKWGELGIWQGKLEDIPDIYGDVCLFWRRK